MKTIVKFVVDAAFIAALFVLAVVSLHLFQMYQDTSPFMNMLCDATAHNSFEAIACKIQH